MNVVVLVGRLTKDPELRYIAGSGKAVATFTLAVDRPFAKEKTADFFRIVVWGKPAENAANYLKKGSQAAVKGMLTSRSYDGSDGQKRYVTEVVADNVEFLSRSEGSGARPEERPFGDNDEFIEFDDTSDIPF